VYYVDGVIDGRGSCWVVIQCRELVREDNKRRGEEEIAVAVVQFYPGEEGKYF